MMTRRQFLQHSAAISLLAGIPFRTALEEQRKVEQGKPWGFPLSFPAYFLSQEQATKMKAEAKNQENTIYLPLVSNG